MRLHLANPNATERMTNLIAEAARRVAGADVEIVATTNVDGPPSIQGPVDGARAVPGLLDRIASTEADAHIVACFDDTGLDAARQLVEVPVVGIGEAACLAATQLADRFVVVTAAPISIPVIRDNMLRTGLVHRCAELRAAGVAVLDIGHGDPTGDPVETAMRQAASDHPHAALVLGCAGMANLATRLSVELARPVVDGVAAATILAQGLVRLTG